jgi:hypothetical protein
MRYQVDTAALRGDVTSVGEVLAMVQRLRIADDLRPLAAALPGGRTAAGLSQVAAAWEARLSSTRWDLRELGVALSAAADGYDAVEQTAQLALTPPAEASR